MGSWCNRVKVEVSGLAKWISCPVVREHGPQWIDQVRIDQARPWRDEIRKTLEINYRKAPHFARAFALIDDLLSFETDRLADFNVNAVRVLAPLVGADPLRCTRQSALPLDEATATERLITICRAVGADAYLCGGGAGGYQDDAAFAAAGIRLEYQRFEAAPYRPDDRFIPGLSVIDWMMHAPEARG
jgi:hypothetical protein